MKNILFLSLTIVISSLFAQREDVYHKYQEDCANQDISACMPIFAQKFLGKPYVAKTLEKNDIEQLVVNFDELDCTTFVETVLAMAITAHSDDRSLESYKTTLQNLRYRQGNIEGYGSRIHYFSDWLYENEQAKVIKSMTQELGGILYEKTINFMSTHTAAYAQLSNESDLQKVIEVENNINSREKFYIPKEKISGIENQLQDGDIIAITTTIEGLDVVHEGIIMKRGEKAFLLHASSEMKKVVLSTETISEYVNRHKNQTGIMVGRAN